MGEDVARIKHKLFGNGAAGMDEDIRKTAESVDRLEKSFEEYKRTQAQKEKSREDFERERMKEAAENRKWIVRAIIGSLLPYILSFLIWIIYWIFKLQPLLQDLEKVTK